MPVGPIGIDVAARFQKRHQTRLRIFPGFLPHRQIHRLTQALHEMLDDFDPAGRRRTNLPIEVAYEHDAVAPANPFLVESEVFIGMSFPQQRQHLAAELEHGQFFIARDLQRGQQAFKGRVPDVALRGRDLAAGEEHHITACDQPVISSFALLLYVGLDAIVAQRRIGANVAPLHLSGAPA